MKSIFTFYFRYILFILGIQVVFRILLLLVYQDLTEDAGIGDQLMALAYGLKLDISLTGYLLVTPTLILILFSIFRKGFFKTVLSIYTLMILVVLIPVFFTNMVTYGYWNAPVDRSVFDYLSTPGEMAASLPLWQLAILLVMITLVVLILYFPVYRKWVSTTMQVLPSGSRQIAIKPNWLSAMVFLFILPVLILPIRGGLATSPLQVGSVYFHHYSFLNHAAVNPVWNLFYTMMESKKLGQSADFYPQEKVELIIDELCEPGSNHLPVLNTETPNIILVLLESFAQPVIKELGGNGEAAPNFNSLISEGIFFSHMFATGTMTDRALGALLGGYPGIPHSCILYYETKAEKLPHLNLKLKSAGYSSAFLYGGDIDFGHFRSFLVIGGFDEIISDKDFPRSVPRSSWGVPDHILFQKLTETSYRAQEPFFHVLLTLSSHAPFDVPMEPVFDGSGHLPKYLNSTYYTDRSLGEFIRMAKTRDWWERTLIILTADHGCRIGNTTAYERKRFSIPMLWLGGALSIRDTVITKYGSQTDLPVTLLNQLELPSGDFRFSKDLLSAETGSYAYYTYNDGIGFVTDSTYAVYCMVTNDYLLKEGPFPRTGIDPGLAYLQYLFHDFNSK